MKNSKLGFLSCFTAALMWGFAFICVDNAIDGGWMTFPLLSVRFMIGFIIMFFVSFKRRWWKDKTIIKLGIQNGILFFLGFMFQTLGQQLSSVPNAAFLTSLNLILVPIFLHYIFKRNIENKVYIASLLALIGAGFLSLDANMRLHIGDIYLIICAVFFAFHIIHNERCGKEDNTLSVITIQLLTMSILSFIMMFVSKQTYIPENNWIDVLYLGVFSSAAAGFLQLFGAKHLDASIASLILCQESVIATFFSIILLNEPVTVKLIIGGSLMIIGCIIVTFKRKSNSN